MATFVELVETAITASAQLASSNQNDASIVESIKQLVETQKNEELFNKFLSYSDSIIEKESSKDAESYFFVLISILFSIPEVKVQQELWNTLLKKVSDNTTSKPDVRLRILINILNSVEHTLPHHFHSFIEVLKYAVNTKQTSFIAKHLQNLDKLLKEWKANEEQKREVYLLAADVSTNDKDAYQFYYKYLQTFSDNFTEKSRDVAAKTIARAIRMDNFQFDELLDLPAVQDLKNVDKYSKLVELLEILFSGTYNDYISFYEKNKTLLSDYDLSHDDVSTKMRLLALCGLCLGKEEVDYDSIAKTLHIDPKDVEMWVVRGVGSGLIKAQMDQLKRVIFVTKAFARDFTQENWEQIEKKLNTWKDTIDNLTKRLEQGIKVEDVKAE